MITQTEESFYQKQDNKILKESSLVGKQARRFQIFCIPCTSCLLKPTVTPAMLSTREVGQIPPWDLSPPAIPAWISRDTPPFPHLVPADRHKMHSVSAYTGILHIFKQTLQQEQPSRSSDGATAESQQETTSNFRRKELMKNQETFADPLSFPPRVEKPLKNPIFLKKPLF